MSGPRRYLIATAISHYPHAPEWDRPGLVEARRTMVDLFTGTLGYEHVSDLGANPTQQQLLWELREFSRAPDRRPDDIVAVYIAGHGERLDAEEYVLLTSDTHPDDLYDALQPAQLARKILAGTNVRRLLLMLDTCYSGQGGNELLASMARLKSGWREKDAGLAVITSAQPNELARTGAFPELLAEAVTSLATAGFTPELLSLDAVVKATAANPEKPDFQHIGLEIIGLTGAIPPFLPNAKHSPRLSHTDMALQRAAEWDEQDRRRDVEFRTRLLRRAMGHSDTRHVGWWFSGRGRALEDITRWLAELPPEKPSLVVTAGPGSGKTAVLGLLSAVSDPDYRRTVPLATLGLTTDQLPPPHAIRTAIYAQGLTDQQVVRALAAALRLPPTEAVADLLNHLNSRPQPPRPEVLLIDGLDEAATPTTLCAQVLRPLTELAAPHLRLLLGTRPHLLTPLGLDRTSQIDLDAPAYADSAAVRAYAVRNLIDAHPESPYLHCPRETLLAVAEAVADAADRSFLVARIVAGTAATMPAPPEDPWDTAWRRSLPRAAADAMHYDLHQRFDAGAQRILDLLRPLAYAEGQGLPWEDIWAPIASRLSGLRYTNEDLLQLRRDAGAYVVEAVEDGRSVYRLYHEAMAEYLRQGQDAVEAHAGFVEVLRRAVPYEGDGRRDWGRAHPYALRHLVTHAATAGRLDSLLADLEYLVHAECDTLTPHLMTVESDTARLHAAMYAISLQVHRGLDAADRRRLLAVNAARFNEPGALEVLNSRAAEGAWRPLAASGSQVSGQVHHVLVGHADAVNVVACTELNGRPVAVSTSSDHTLRIWDLATGHAVGSPLTGHTSFVLALACTQLDGRPVAVSGDYEVRVWDLATGHLIGKPLAGHTAAIELIACTQLEGRPIAVSCDELGTVWIWDLATGEPVSTPLTGFHHPTDLVCAVVDGRTVAVISTLGRGLQFWDLGTQHSLDTWAPSDDIWNSVLHCTEQDGRPVVIGVSDTGAVRVWDLRTFQLLAEWQGPTEFAMSITTMELDGRTVVVIGSDGGGATFWDLESHNRVGPFLKGHSSEVCTVASTSVAGQPVVVTGSSDETVRVWNVSVGRPVGRPMTAHTSTVTDIALGHVRGRPVFVTISDDHTLRLWDRLTGQPLGEPMAGDHHSEGSLACALLGNRTVVVSGGFLGVLQVRDVETGQRQFAPVKYESIADVACTALDGCPVVVAALAKGLVRVHDMETGEPLYEPLTGHTSAVTSVACTDLDGRTVAVTTSYDETLRVWDLAAGRPLGDPMPNGAGPVACTVLNGRAVAVSCVESHAIQVRDLLSGQPVTGLMTGHTGTIAALVCAELDGHPVAVSGSTDNTVRIWDLRTGTLAHTLHVPGECNAVALDETGLLICAFGSDVGIFRRG